MFVKQSKAITCIHHSFYTKCEYFIKYSVLLLSCSLLLSSCSNSSDTTVETLNNDKVIDVSSGYTADFDSVENTLGVPIACRNEDIVKAFAQKTSTIQVKGCGQVDAVLQNNLKSNNAHTTINDNPKLNNSQDFVVRLEDITPELYVTIMHDINKSSEIPNLQKGDQVIFYGEYNYTKEGGIVHHTHQDTTEDIKKGWVEKNGKRTQ